MFEMLATLGIVVAGSYLVTRAVMLSRPSPSKVAIPNGAKLKLLTPSGAYRCHVEKTDKTGIVTSAPLFRDSYVPLRIGEKVVVQVALQDRLLTFHTSVLSRDGVYHRVTLAHPKAFRWTERRSEVRTRLPRHSDAMVNGVAASLVDVSPTGVRIHTLALMNAGDFVEIAVPSSGSTLAGWVLGSSPVAIGNRMGRELRIRLDDPAPLFRAKAVRQSGLNRLQTSTPLK